MVVRIVTEHTAFVELDTSEDIEKATLTLRKALTDWSKRLNLPYWAVDSRIDTDIYVVNEWKNLMKKEEKDDSNRD